LLIIAYPYNLGIYITLVVFATLCIQVTQKFHRHIRKVGSKQKPLKAILKQLRPSLTIDQNMVCYIVIILVSSWNQLHVQSEFHLHYFFILKS